METEISKQANKFEGLKELWPRAQEYLQSKHGAEVGIQLKQWKRPIQTVANRCNHRNWSLSNPANERASISAGTLTWAQANLPNQWRQVAEATPAACCIFCRALVIVWLSVCCTCQPILFFLDCFNQALLTSLILWCLPVNPKPFFFYTGQRHRFSNSQPSIFTQ